MLKFLAGLFGKDAAPASLPPLVHPKCVAVWAKGNMLTVQTRSASVIDFFSSLVMLAPNAGDTTLGGAIAVALPGAVG